MTSDLKNDFAYLAVIDAYKWWICNDFHFLTLTGILEPDGSPKAEIGKMDVDVLRRIARAYSVSRNIPSHTQDIEATCIVEGFKEADFLQREKLSFADRATRLVAYTNANPVRLKTGADGRDRYRRPASAFSKLSWFLRPDDWTIFDKFVGIAVLKKGGVGPEKMDAFYSNLSPTWDSTMRAMTDVVEDQGFNRLLAYRIADKYLFYHGISHVERTVGVDGKAKEVIRADLPLERRLENPVVADHRSSLVATGRVLAKHLDRKLELLAEATAPVLDGAGWV